MIYFSVTGSQLLDPSILLNLHGLQFLLITKHEQMGPLYLEGACGVLKDTLSVAYFLYYISIQELSVSIVASQTICSLRVTEHQRGRL